MSTSAKSLVRRLRVIPDAVRQYEFDAVQAHAHFGLDVAALDGLVAAGLPCRRTPNRLYEFADLHYLGLALGHARTYLSTIRRWTGTLAQLSASTSTRLAIAYMPRLEPTAPDGVRGTVHLPGGDVRHVVLQDGRPAARIQFSSRGDWPAIPRSAARAAATLATNLDFYMLPVAAQGDTQLARKTGLADCWTAACLLREECSAIGVEARLGHGLLLSLPFSTMHSWAELRSHDTWVPVDPLMIKLMRSYGGLNSDDWPWDRSIGPMCLRICNSRRPLVVRPTGDVAATFLTTVVDGASTPGAAC